jgi:protein required for attachment to host cells
MMLPHNSLVAVLDGEHLNLFINKGDETDIDLAASETAKLDHANAGSGLRHHHEASNPDADRKREDGHSAAAAHLLNKLCLDRNNPHIVIIADPKTLGELRKHYHPTLQKRVLAEIPKDLAGRPASEIIALIRST